MPDVCTTFVSSIFFECEASFLCAPDVGRRSRGQIVLKDTARNW